MALTKLPIMPGFHKDDTPAKVEGYAIGGKNIRYRYDAWQVRGGWEEATSYTFDGIVRGAHAWSSQGSSVAMFGTAAKLYSLLFGEIRDITPLKAKGTLTDPFTTLEIGSPTVLVTSAAHGLAPDDVVTYALADAVGGITIDGAYTVTIRDNDSYYITHSSNATSVATGGGKVEYTVPLDVGLVDSLPGLGYGMGDYGDGPYGGTPSGNTQARVWSVDNWGLLGVAIADLGPLYEYQPLLEYDELVVNGAFASTASWTTGTGWSIGAGVATAVAGSASDLSQDLTGIISGGVTYEMVFTVVRTAGSFQFRVTSEPGGVPTDITLGDTISKSGTYTRRWTAPANPTTIKFAKDNAFAGTIDDVSIKVVSTAYRIHDAPQYSLHMFVDPNRFVVLCGTVEADGDYNPMLVRWCDQENNRTWTPDDDNKAGEYPLAIGSEIRGGLVTKGQNLILTDAALYSMRFVSNDDVFSFDLIATGCGLLNKNSIIELNGAVFWIGTDYNVYIYQGGVPQVLVNTCGRDVFDNLSAYQEAKIAAGINPAFDEVCWQYPDARDSSGANKECSRELTFNFAVNAFYTNEGVARSEWLGSGIFDKPIGFGLDGVIYYHEQGQTADGDALDWQLTTGAYDLGEGDTLQNINRYIPDFEDQTGAVKVALSFRQWPASAWVAATDPSTSFTYYTVTAATEKVDLRHTGRQMMVDFSGSASPAFVRFGANKLDITPSGARR